MAFADDETRLPRAQPMARVATVAPDGQHDVTPVALEATTWLIGRLRAHQASSQARTASTRR